jgi:hypothetical protein
MKRKLLIGVAVVFGLFIAVIVIASLMSSSQKAGENYHQPTLTADGKLTLQPPEHRHQGFSVTATLPTNAAPAK